MNSIIAIKRITNDKSTYRKIFTAFRFLEDFFLRELEFDVAIIVYLKVEQN
ncbi:hypothetical protein GCM10009117_09130 [Gangjinia marincola]|uniref:Uncharacterized protein n=1 Tax=Gangjinia marincola TaxID=578463 RepID=A0ABP3XRJ9_9FLAO